MPEICSDGHRVSQTRLADSRSPGPDPLPPGKVAVHADHERAVSAALERAAVTLMMIAALLWGGFVFLARFTASVEHIRVVLGIPR
jgi:hypothetical protein